MPSSSVSYHSLHPNAIFISTLLFCFACGHQLLFSSLANKAQKDFLITAPQIISSVALSGLLSPLSLFSPFWEL